MFWDIRAIGALKMKFYTNRIEYDLQAFQALTFISLFTNINFIYDLTDAILARILLNRMCFEI